MAQGKDQGQAPADQPPTNQDQPGDQPPAMDNAPDDMGPRRQVPPGTPAEPGPGQQQASWRDQQLQDAMRYVPKPRDRRQPSTSGGPLEPDEVMSEQELWQRAEAEHLSHNRRELERAAQLGELLVVESNLADDRVAFSEIDDRHPHSHCYVAGRDTPPQIVARTEGIEQAILDRKIRVVQPPGDFRLPSGDDDQEEEQQTARSRRR